MLHELLGFTVGNAVNYVILYVKSVDIRVAKNARQARHFPVGGTSSGTSKRPTKDLLLYQHEFVRVEY